RLPASRQTPLPPTRRRHGWLRHEVARGLCPEGARAGGPRGESSWSSLPSFARRIELPYPIEAPVKLNSDLTLVGFPPHPVQKCSQPGKVLEKPIRAGEGVDDYGVLPDDLALVIQPPALHGGHGRRTAVDLGEQLNRFQHPLALIADLLSLSILVRDVDGEALGRGTAIGAERCREIDPLLVLLFPCHQATSPPTIIPFCTQ